jgi:Ca2+-binding RTX toxin-like protein
LDDLLPEQNETFGLVVRKLPFSQDPTSPHLAFTTFTILDNDIAKPQVTSFAATGVATEGGTLQFRVDLDKAVAQTTTLSYTITGGTAESSDYSSPGSVTINAGNSVGFINIQTNQDSDTDNETLTLQLNTSSAIDTFNRSATGTIRDDDTALTAAQLFAANNGKFATLADFSVAAYADAKDLATRNDLKTDGWRLLEAGDLGGLAGLSGGMYVNGNAQALIAEASNALVIAFRGTDEGWDYANWPLPFVHYDKFAPLIEAIGSYRSSVPNIYVTGHSLGAAMAQNFMNQHSDSKYEAATFASPGAIDFFDLSDARTVNFRTEDDPIRGAQLIPPYHWVGDDKGILFNDGVDGFNFTLFSQHSRYLYSTIMHFISDERVDEALFAFGGYDKLIVPSGSVVSEYAIGVFDYFDHGRGIDTLTGSADDEILVAGPAADVLTGGAGKDRLYGGAGNDTYFFSRSSGSDAIFDASGTDTIYYHGNALEGLFTFSGDLVGGLSGPTKVGNNLVLTFNGGASITIESYFSAAGANRIERFIDGNEGLINGPDSEYSFSVGTGELLLGEAGSRSYLAVLAGTNAATILDDGDLSIAAAAIGLVGTRNAPSVGMLAAASEADDHFDDWLFGADGVDTLSAHDGDDVLFGGAQNDQLTGGTGNDFLDGGAGADRLDGGADTASSGGLGDAASYAFAPGGVSVSLATGSGTRGDAAGDTLIGIENLVGSEFADDLAGNAGTNLVLGLGGNDRITGGAGIDGIDGGPGVDTAVYSGPRSAYTLIRHGNSLEVSGPDGSDVLTSVEKLAFSDVTIPSGLGLVPTDFTGDGMAELLWQHKNGTPAIWTMNGTAFAGGTLLFNPGPSWHAKAAADFTGDGKADILWQNDSGLPAIWTMDGSTMTSGALLPNPSPTWHAIAAADFSGDGKADILWQNDNGTPAVWIMDGTVMTSAALLINPSPSWHAKAAADFTGDGKADILWQNDNGTPAIWTMDGTTMTSGALLFNPGPSWHVEAAADFNGDGKADILWQNDNGTPAIWTMDGTTMTAGALLFNPGPSWHIDEAVDVTGDGKADILWQNDSGLPAIWQMDGSTMASAALLPNPSPEWHLV